MTSLPDPLSLDIETRQDGPDLGYEVVRIPTDPTTPGSGAVGEHSFVVRATRAGDRLAGQIQVALEQAAGKTVTTGVHCSPLAHRSLHLDAGRHYFPVPEIKQIMQLMAWARLNVLNLHISDTHGYRISSQLHPEIVAGQHLEAEEVNEIVEYAATLGIEVVPSFDMPGHLHKVLEPNQWAGLKDDCGNLIPGALNILDEGAKELVWDLLDEVVDMFSAKTVTVGADEFLEYGTRVHTLEQAAKEKFGPRACAADLWIDFANQCVERLARRGLKANLFNDGVHVDALVMPSRQADIFYWTRWGAHMMPPQRFAQLGYRLHNWDGQSLYFILREPGNCQIPTFESVWANFDPNIFPDKAGTFRTEPAGANFSVWCDQPQTMSGQEIITKLVGPLFAFGQILWPTGRRRNEADTKALLDSLLSPQP
ncbi:hypothetical protein HMPREF2835_06795 [Actinomyces sp. HMSC072A03]|nr:hypothetical protein HMPREF2835_06795 [Actinomyces sp. HMSC072A03]